MAGVGIGLLGQELQNIKLGIAERPLVRRGLGGAACFKTPRNTCQSREFQGGGFQQGRMGGPLPILAEQDGSGSDHKRISRWRAEYARR